MAAAIPELLGLTLGEGIAFALGTALAPALRPLTQEYENAAWHEAVGLIGGDSLKPLGVGDLASIVAESVEALGWGRDEAAKQGITQKDFDALFHAAEDAPGFGVLLQMLRRNLIDVPQFEHGLRKAKFEGRWDTALEALREVLLSPADLAMMRQQGFIGPARQHSESALQGVNAERADLMFEASGLPPGVAEGLTMLRRKIINREVFGQIVREGHTKTKYTDDLLALERTLLTVTQYVDAHLRGYITEAEMYEGTALWGLSRDDTDTIFQSHGRPLPIHQVTTGLARGGRYNGPQGDIPDAYINSLRQGSIKPTWYDLAYANRYTYPSAFVIRGLAQSGARTEAQVEQALLFIGWPPDWAKDVAAFWTAPTGAKADTHEAKAQTQLWGTLHRAYMAGDVTDAQVTAKLPQAGVTAAAVPTVLATWKHEREIQRQRITPAQLKKAWRKAVTNESTQAPWTKEEVLAELLSRGWSHLDANTFLDTPTGK